MLRLDQQGFASLTHLAVGAVRRLEKKQGPIVAAPGVIEAVRIALEGAGIELIEPGAYEGVGGPGLRLKGAAAAAADDVIDFEEAVEELKAAEAHDEQIVPDASRSRNEK